MKKIALVEDNPDNRLLVHAILESVYDIDEYENGADALAAFTRRVPDLVLLDISLPGLDGPEVLREIRKDERMAGLPVVALTAHAMMGDRERFLGAGFDAYVSKPIIDEQDILSTIEKCLAERGLSL